MSLEDIVFVFTTVVRLLIYALDICIFVRIILSWFPGSDDSALGDFVFTLTEPLLGFIRVILQKISIFRDLPIDFSPFIAGVLLSIILMVL